MNIAFIDVTCTNSVGGIQTKVWSLAKVLSDLGHQVTLYGGNGDIRHPEGNRPVTVVTFPFTPRERFWDFGTRFRRIAERISFARQAHETVAAAGHDWIILTKPFDFFWPWLPKQTARFAFYSGGTDFFVGDRFLAKRIKIWFACSHFNAWQIKTRYRHYPIVPYNGVDIDLFTPAARNPSWRATLGLPENAILFTFAGRFVGWKGVQVAIRALASPRLQNKSIHLCLVGAGEAYVEWETLAKEIGVIDRVHFYGAVPHHELPVIYASSDVGIFPSIGDEAFGITIAEAMASGLPVIASTSGGIPEVIGNEGNCGLLAAIGGVEETAMAMKTLADDAPLRLAMGQRARHRIQSRFTWVLSAKRLLQALEST